MFWGIHQIQISEKMKIHDSSHYFREMAANCFAFLHDFAYNHTL
jgi:hypothetical protein